MTRLARMLEASWTALPDKPDETIDGTLRALRFAAAGDPRALHRVSDPLPDLTALQERTFEALVRRRAAGVPLAHLSGRQGFLGLELLAGAGALIPRRETELLARTAIALLPQNDTPGQPGPRVLDLCAGAGNVALAIAVARADCSVMATDLEIAACALAAANAEHLGLGDRLRVRRGDLFAALDDPPRHAFDVITCNPPYISSAGVDKLPREIRSFEPRRAFDGGAFGLDVVLRVLREAPTWLTAGGWLCLEVGEGQSDFVAKRLRGARFTEVRAYEDAHGVTRVLAAAAGS